VNLYELESFGKRLEEFERALVRSGQPKKYMLDIRSVHVVLNRMIEEERKKANG
jgi:hypothetical protein